MKKTLISIVAIAFAALMIANVYAPLPPVPAPPCGGCGCGFTPGFWKHDIQVRLSHAPYNLGLTNGAYNAFEGGPKDGIKLTDAMMDGFLAKIKAKPGMSGFTFQLALEFLKLPGWSADRTNTANWFNWAAGYGPF